ncbi:MAG: tRNA (adenosine(37)-N6)-dimethylallyltransferase MiaA [Alistipes sp.]|nr:tRNA (adenosine(37)-N6)-dimethylallyltransferase MiaA [Alistipes sp.]
MTATTTNTKRGTLIVVVGPTGSGKTALAIALARHYGAPIISTDSRQVFRGLPIGTAQPTAEEQAAAKHYFIADREVEDDFNCGKYEVEALALLEQLFAESDYVVAVGGSGLYIQALCDGMDNLPEADVTLRENLKQRLANEGIDSLVAELRRLDPAYAESVDRCNPARVMRALEVCLTTGRPYSEQRHGTIAERPFNIIKVGTDLPRDILYDRINRRVDLMVEEGLVEEARAMYHKRHLNALQTVGYRELFDYFDGNISLNEAIELIKRNSRHYAKRQLTWFRRDERVGWFSPEAIDAIVEYIDNNILQN